MSEPSSANHGRKGRPWRRIREQVFALHGTRCHICGQLGATTVDHVLPTSRTRTWLTT